jgi:hypothetical protein
LLAFIDESGSLHPNDPVQTPVLAAVCMSEEVHRALAGLLFRLKRVIYQVETPSGLELHAKDLLNKTTFRRAFQGNTKAAKAASLVDSIFDALYNDRELASIRIFAIVMEKPSEPIKYPKGFLPLPINFLLRPINRFMQVHYPEKTVTIIFDSKDLEADRNLAIAFNSFMFKSTEGQSYRQTLDTPFFADSVVTPGLQLADLIASTIRHAWENNLNRPGAPLTLDPFLSSIRRYYLIIQEKTEDFSATEVYPHEVYGIYFASADKIYYRAPEIEQK